MTQALPNAPQEHLWLTTSAGGRAGAVSPKTRRSSGNLPARES
jgi:hypothetical protein